MADERTAPLSGAQILVIEDEYYLADDLSRELRAAGADVVGPFASISEAEPAIERGNFDCAVLDMNLRGELAFQIAEQLDAANVTHRNRLRPEFAATLARADPADRKTIRAK